MTTSNAVQFWLEYRKDNGLSKHSFTDETSMKIELKRLIKSGCKPKIIDLTKQITNNQLAVI